MKNLFIILCINFVSLPAFCFYDFCQSPQDYNTFPAAYDFKTEYWKDIPDYNTGGKIKLKNTKNKHKTNEISSPKNIEQNLLENTQK